MGIAIQQPLRRVREIEVSTYSVAAFELKDIAIDIQ